VHNEEAMININSIMNKVHAGGSTASQVALILDVFTQKGMITIEKSMSDPFHTPKVILKAINPLKGKGKSYGQHVSGNDGWGQYINPDRCDNWNDGKW